MTKDKLYTWLEKNGWKLAKRSPLGGYEGWIPGDRTSVHIFILESTVIVQGREAKDPTEVQFEDITAEDNKLILGDVTVLGRLSTSPTYGRYTLRCKFEAIYTSRTAEEFEEAADNAEDRYFHDIESRYTSLDITRGTDAWEILRFVPETEEGGDDGDDD